ncbi:hypothetical protein EVG20_g3840 [Dentipellis fragilis]|uniref:Uncharacterized protein n=1 Tax=Dentipellis fragilis TaxID=205917 RepID=A0A4Y9Z1M1_9AGAM|nr:hypothetical protein EVG20_g3840 [Dentipellis fragilis]
MTPRDLPIDRKCGEIAVARRDPTAGLQPAAADPPSSACDNVRTGRLRAVYVRGLGDIIAIIPPPPGAPTSEPSTVSQNGNYNYKWDNGTWLAHRQNDCCSVRQGTAVNAASRGQPSPSCELGRHAVTLLSPDPRPSARIPIRTSNSQQLASEKSKHGQHNLLNGTTLRGICPRTNPAAPAPAGSLNTFNQILAPK